MLDKETFPTLNKSGNTNYQLGQIMDENIDTINSVLEEVILCEVFTSPFSLRNQQTYLLLFS